MSLDALVFGGGQLASELKKSTIEPLNCRYLSRSEFDLVNSGGIKSIIKVLNPKIVINAAAYTAVDKAESEAELALSINATAPGEMALACEEIGAYFLHVSTDFVFNGTRGRPYKVDSSTNPIGEYGKGKLAGEQAIKTNMSKNYAIIRTSWVYAAEGGNFVHTMLRLMKEKDSLSVIGDQVGTPTWAKGLADVCWLSAKNKLQGVYHWTDAGVASWYDFAVAIQEFGLELGLLQAEKPINSIATEQYPTPARRPAYSVLDKSDILSALPDVQHNHWRHQLLEMMKEI